MSFHPDMSIATYGVASASTMSTVVSGIGGRLSRLRERSVELAELEQRAAISAARSKAGREGG